MKFTIINKENWKRQEYFEHYYSKVPCTYSMSVKIDITKIRKSNQKLYPTMLYYITKVVNTYSEFRTTFDMNGELGVFDKMIPSYTVFNKDTETFCNLWTDYSEDYNEFCRAYEKDVEEFGTINKLMAKPHIPANNFTVSMIPWTTFEGFNLNLPNGNDYLLPIFTMGKYYEENDRYMLPFVIQVHHAVCDGFHVCRFINELQRVLNE